MKDYIYKLYETKTGTVFYIGRTIDPRRRYMEHKLGALNYKIGDEDKYMYASALDAAGINWDLEVIHECGPGSKDFEDYFVNKYRNSGSPIMNMRAGDDGPWIGRDYKTPEEFVAAKADGLLTIKKARQAAKLAEKARIKRSTIDNDPLAKRVLFVGEDYKKKFISPALQAIFDRRAKK